MKNRYLTKSISKLATECPTKLFYKEVIWLDKSSIAFFETEELPIEKELKI